jgi:hypothetical protein
MSSMSEGTSGDSDPKPLQFETAEGTGAPSPATLACSNCSSALTTEYYEASGRMVCPSCRTTISTLLSDRGGKERFILASVYGSGAALIGALLWWAVRAGTGYEVGLIAVAVGFMVGYAVRAGAQGRGGRRFQILAVLLTYAGISLNYVPDIIKGLGEAGKAAAEKEQKAAATGASADPSAATTAPAVAAKAPGDKDAAKASFSLLSLILLIGLVLGLAAAAPFLGGASNVIGLLIIGFALWEAWKMNRQAQVVWSGPFQVGAPPAGTESAPAPATL